MWIRRLAAFFSHYRGLPVLVGILLVVANFGLQFLPLGEWAWVAETGVLLHVGVIAGLLGLLIGDALG
jgi:hypothetical protein